jgi:hypothetical protein
VFYRIVLYTCYLYYMLLCYALPHTLNMTRFQLNMSRGDDFPLGVSSHMYTYKHVYTYTDTKVDG